MLLVYISNVACIGIIEKGETVSSVYKILVSKK